MDQEQPQPRTLKFIGGHLALDFTNTADWHASAAPRELLDGFDDLVIWARDAGALTELEAVGYAEQAVLRREESALIFQKALDLREAIYGLLRASLQDEAPPRGDLDTLNRMLARANYHRQIGFEGGGYRWQLDSADLPLEAIIWPLLWAAADLLTSDQLQRVGQCADDRGCGWLFLDTSKNQSRRWCDMRACGNRAKALRYSQRH